MSLWQVCGHVMQPQKSGELASVVVRVTVAVTKYQEDSGDLSQVTGYKKHGSRSFCHPVSFLKISSPYFILFDLS